MNYLSFCLLILGTTQMSAQYCTTGVGPTSTADSNVDSIGLTGDAATAINYQKVCTATGLEDLTATLSASVTAGSNYDVTVVFGTCGTTPYAGAGEVWIDWNQNDAFDPTESIGTWTGSPTDTNTYTFTVPAGAFNGTTRMRVMHQEGNSLTLPLNPCGSYTWGSLADFSIVVSGGVTLTCANPSMLTSANLTATSADLGWMENGTATSWQISYGAPNAPAGSGVTMVTGTNPINLTGLMPNASYDFYVRAICGVGDTSVWVGPLNFTTLCPASFTPTYSENFTTYLNACWSEAQGVLGTGTVLTGTTSNWVADGFGNVGTTGAAKINLYATGRDEWIVSPSIDLGTGTTPYQIEFDIALTDFANTNVGPLGVDDTFAVVISTDNGATWDVANTLQAWLPGSEPSNTGDHIVIDLSAYTGVVKFGFYAASSVSNEDNDIFIDNFLVTNLATCPSISNLAISNIAANAADLAWTENGTATSWIVEYGAPGFTPGTGTMVTAGTNPFTLTGLIPTTPYDVYVRAFCAVGDTSSYGIARNFVTIASCPAPTALAVMSATPTTANLAWTENGSATNWQVEYGATGFAQGTGNNNFTTSNPFTATSLMPNTAYQFYVRAVCGPADSSLWAGPFAFSTPCAAVTAPYLETFATNALPACWMQGGATNWEYGSISGTTPAGFADYGANAVPDHSVGGNGTFIGMDGSDNTNGEVSTLMSPLVDIAPLTSPELSYWVFSNNTDDAAQNKLIVEFYDGANWTVIDSIQTNLGTGWVEFKTNLSTFTITGNAQVRFTLTGDNSAGGFTFYNDILIDDVAFRNAPPANLVITEIMYNPPESNTDTLEFVEIYNNGAAANLSNYTLSGITYTFPAVTLPAGGYYVIGVNASAFNTVYGFAADGIATGGLSNGGEAVIIRDAAGTVVDSVRYDDSAPWPTGSGAGQPDGGGASLVLCDTASDNADGANWNACVTSTGMTINGNTVLASPGAANFCPAPLDVAVASFYNLDSIYCNVATITGSVIITNMSTTDATNVPYTITANGTPLGAGTITLLAGNASDTITVGPFPAATGIANIVATTSLTGDVNASNDMLSMLVSVSNTTATATVLASVDCNGDSTGSVVAVSADGIGAYTYEWNADPNWVTDTLTNLPANMYTVVVMDSVGCTDTAMVTLTEPTTIVLTDTVNNVLCNGDSTGMAIVMATGGTPAYSYAWSNGMTSDTIMNAAAGSYTVTVTDANGCMEMLTSTIVEPTALDVTITDNGDGTAYATATGGTAGYAFLWDAAAGNQTTDTATALIHNGTYMVTVTDANGCTDTASVVINFISINNIANLSNLNLFPNPTSANVFVELELIENADVQINITNSIGQLVISKELTNVQSEKVELNTSTLASGVYMVQFTIGTELVSRKFIVNK